MSHLHNIVLSTIYSQKETMMHGHVPFSHCGEYNTNVIAAEFSGSDYER